MFFNNNGVKKDNERMTQNKCFTLHWNWALFSYMDSKNVSDDCLRHQFLDVDRYI